MNIYVGNMSKSVSEDDLKEAFGAFGELTSVNVIMDKVSGESKGFGFVEMSLDDEGKAAIEGLNGKDLKGQSLKVNEAHARSEKSSHGGRRY